MLLSGKVILKSLELTPHLIYSQKLLVLKQKLAVEGLVKKPVPTSKMSYTYDDHSKDPPKDTPALPQGQDGRRSESQISYIGTDSLEDIFGAVRILIGNSPDAEIEVQGM
ncbi:hypothetical protein B0H15DRAFT_796949 [Mycena belliarum]|uniref:Uncharacterized protein n=1 Tax=Mycena belliarum TaxID=1033014 RepID=A0AAD6XX82_9AGAR|nr:hypothetical protein B0H15DRAFT_796949 [Mycena belliae]